MFCSQCGKPIIDGAKYCRYCGSLLPIDCPKDGVQLIEDQRNNGKNESGKTTDIFESKNETEIAQEHKDDKQSAGVGCLSVILILIAGAIGKAVAKSYIKDPVANLYISHIFGGVFIGSACGLLPYYLSKKRLKENHHTKTITFGSLLLCSVAGLLGGYIMAIPASVVLSSCIWYLSNKQK